ncbi:ATP-dependent DNA ligase LigD phosphoesterase module /ATP-dependent DNA ligase LigD polymerase module [Palleronia marisminoris]|uniref:DNA ligase (ATP) n=1 Tax=Palleronia marisminoris TaxID=315423 RepID=A0A1Y5RZN8_9RHOB|nr:DNA ligase D [Palleronia marisminoris]SFG40094.1 ATP-dependent DNA ligase LigD phosphoesterase module /ATP-dependent DNA ligase LigD polymerase module [Palleronia marisminoris]SLN28998.1 Putative DNA ligase-like protein/MT0965 [Palleronia marisminoris]
MGLETYNKKRDFEATPEPRGEVGASKSGDSYLIQKHAARRLHYDLRLELDGVLLSWAVTKGPSLVPGEKRLAVQTEDHPLTYGDFEGTIPKGEYGGGTVVLWDRGSWKPLNDPRTGLKKGHLEFEIQGEKLGGRWHLTRMARKAREKRDNWLLIKGDDEFAREEGDPQIVEERPESVKTGRNVDEVAGEAPGWSSKTGKLEQPQEELPPMPAKAKEATYPDFIPPALATLRSAAPSGEKWLHEIKFDGYRLQAHVREGKATLFTRSGYDWTDRFGKAIPAALGQLDARDTVIDGEVIVEGPSGASDFSALQADLSEGRTDRLVYFAFDILHLDGKDLRPAPLIDRKATLEALLRGAPDVLRYSEHFEENGDLVLRHACRLSLEGVISKERNAPYRSGRGKTWIKSKCSERQEFVVAGYTPSSTSRRAIGSLILGYHDDGDLVHAGRVGTGFTQNVAADLFKRLDEMKQKENPFAAELSAEDARNAIFVQPELVAEVEFRAWTASGNVRHASFRGLREDRNAEEVVRESEDSVVEKPRPAVRLTSPDRLYWKDEGVTKQGLADYYSDVWSRMGPFVVNRPLALVRCPDGVGGQCFFQKHAWRGQSAEILKAHDPKDKDDEPIIAVDSLPGLLGMVQGGTLEIHPWGAQITDLERPDFINMDLDPGPGVSWQEVIEAALEVRERLREVGLESFVKTSGGKGLHVVAPLKPKAEWPEVKAFAKGIADAMASDSPDQYVATITKSKRKGKTLIDYLRNGRGATAVAPYSTRARPGAAVSMPLEWDELSGTIGPDFFTVTNSLSRIANTPDPWADFWKAAKPLAGSKRKAR